MATSLQYLFQTIDADLVIRDAFERCGIENWLEDRLKYDGARRSLNFLFSHWVNKGLNLFTIDQQIIQIVPGQATYLLPLNTSKILEAKLAQSNRLLGGIPSSSAGGNAGAPFTPTITGNCTQVSANGNISYLYPTPTPVLYVGVMSANTNLYQLAIECSFLNAPTDADWITILETPQIQYYNQETQWFSLPFTKGALNWRIREFGGATLNITQINFAVPILSIPMRPIGRDLYFQYQPNQISNSTTTYWINRVLTPTLNVYPIPTSGQYNLFVFNRVHYIQDIGDFFNSVDAVSRFLESATAGLAAKLAEKWAVERFEMLSNTAEKVYIEAGKEDEEDVDKQVNFSLDMM